MAGGLAGSHFAVVEFVGVTVALRAIDFVIVSLPTTMP